MRMQIDQTKRNKALLRMAAVRRLTVRDRKNTMNGQFERDAKAEARQRRRLANYEHAGVLAERRIKACLKYPTPHAIRQLSEIMSDSAIPNPQRIEAAIRMMELAH